MASSTALCLSCRTLLGQAETCDECAGATVVSLVEREGFRRAKAAAWEPIPLADDAVTTLSVGTALAGATAATVGMLLFGAIALIGGILLTVAAIVAFAVLGQFRLISFRSRPRGVTAELSPRAPAVRGRILGDRRDHVVASATELRLVETGSGVTLRAGSSDGFEIELADGRRVEVPVGPIRVVFAAEAAEIVEAGALHDLGLSEFDVCFPYDQAHRIALHEGDEVELLGELASDADYRSQPLLRPRGVACLRKF